MTPTPLVPKWVAVMRKPVLMEDGGWPSFIGAAPSYAEAETMLDDYVAGSGGYFSRSDFYVTGSCIVKEDS